MAKSSAQENYFNLIMTGCGYINELKVKKAKDPTEKDEVRLKVAMLHGKASKPSKEYYWLSVPGEGPRDLLRPYAKQIGDENVPIFFTCVLSKGDSSPFIFEEGKKACEAGVNHFGTLLEITRLQVGKDVVFTKEPKNDAGYQEAGTFN